MKIAKTVIVLIVCLGIRAVLSAEPQAASTEDRIELGRLATGSVVSFVRGPSGQWGMEIAGPKAVQWVQPQPARLEVFKTEDDIRQIATGYKAVEKKDGTVLARAEVAYGSGVVFRVEDRWTVSGAVLSVRRKVDVQGDAAGCGFYSAVMLSTTPDVTWPDLDYLAPGLLYTTIWQQLKRISRS